MSRVVTGPGSERQLVPPASRAGLGASCSGEAWQELEDLLPARLALLLESHHPLVKPDDDVTIRVLALLASQVTEAWRPSPRRDPPPVQDHAEPIEPLEPLVWGPFEDAGAV